MSIPLIIAGLWVIAGTFVAFLPMRLQYVPGFCLLLAAPVLIGWIGIVHGFFLAGIGLVAFVSMFRRPLSYLAKKLTNASGEIVR